MSYTTVYGHPQGASINIANFLRESLIAEIVAINTYSHHVKQTEDDTIRHILIHILEEEQQHYNEFLKLIRQFDHEQYVQYLEVEEHMEGEDNFRFYVGNSGKKEDTLTLLREDIKGENEAIILYENKLNQIDNQYVCNVVAGIIRDEKHHVEELNYIIQRG